MEMFPLHQGSRCRPLLTLVRPESASSPWPPVFLRTSVSGTTFTDCLVSSTLSAGIARFSANDTGYWGNTETGHLLVRVSFQLKVQCYLTVYLGVTLSKNDLNSVVTELA